MELTSQKREVKLHGTYGFPVYVGRKLISAYPTGSFPWHWHDEVEFTLAAAGRMEYRVNDSRYLLSAGEGLFCNSGALHSGSMRETDCDYISITVHPRLLSGFEGSLVGAKYVAPLVESQGLSSILLTRREPWQAIVLEYLNKIYELCSHRPEGYELLVQTHFMQIWVELSAHCAAQAGGGQSEDPEKLRRLREILTFLHEHYADKITLEDIAAHVGLCKSECCRFFKRQMGTPLFDYLLDYRVGKSLINLKEGSSVSEAAEAAGFNDPSYYAKVFRAHTGRSPSQYRKEIGDRSA
ncbi:helix-turn-helix transcriptional regulator [Acutalibacter muris]|uniref:AraC family transcriptional regulator n=1 Tax=Acutalibacter muris TaxID=1796620 RepID=A0A1Z2XRW9_9FIRM|nr:AraC family transcriptional regulator [Acutalibacter muris]ANU55568.1 AraC family transcriptional regulator [Hungateiclostridiaceae bacterium KB18]ASB41194.1 AraC family transcriptional regulator [Acutalibacter muris]QQR30468.1 helix-turn-helix transcriptional regulator [Acutalibacter muris]